MLALRVKPSPNAAPQAQKVLKDLGLKEVNNISLLRADKDTLKALRTVEDWCAVGYPSK